MNAEAYKWHFDYVRLAWDAGFSFDKPKYPNLDKNKICLVDIDRIIKERDVASVERFLPTVVQYMLENDQAELLDGNFVKMFRISQLSVEYLLFCKKYLDNTVVLLKKDISKLKEENKELKLFTEELETHISTLTKQSYMTTFKCEKCPKVFSNESYLSSHMKRRHSNENLIITNVETDQLQSEIKQLKERLNIAEKQLQERDEKIENIKLEAAENESKLKVDEILEKFENFKDKVENDLRILQIEKRFYEDKYNKLFDLYLETNKRENLSSEIVQRKNQKEPEEKYVETVVDKIEMTTQTEKEKLPTKKLQIETVHDKNVFEYKEANTDEVRQNDVGVTIEEKISKFEEQIELKISTGLMNIEEQLQAFWGKLSEIDLHRQTPVKEEIFPQQEVVQVQSKPKIKPRMKLSKPTKFVDNSGDNAEKIKAEIEKIYAKSEVATPQIEDVPEVVKISSVAYDSSPSSEDDKKSDSEDSSETDDSVEKMLPRKIEEEKSKPSTSKLGEQFETSLQKMDQSKEIHDKFRREITKKLNNHLQEMGISPHWKGIPQKTYEKALEIVRHQASILKKRYPDFDNIRKSIEESLNNNSEMKEKIRSLRSSSSSKKPRNVINIKYRKKGEKLKSESETKSIVTIKNRSLYNTDSDTEVQIVKPALRTTETVPAYSAVVNELKASQSKNADTDSDINSIVLPKEELVSKGQAKSVLKNYPSAGSLTKKNVLFDLESDKTEVGGMEVEHERRGSLTSIDSSDIIKEVDDEKQEKKKGSSLSDFDLSEL